MLEGVYTMPSYNYMTIHTATARLLFLLSSFYAGSEGGLNVLAGFFSEFLVYTIMLGSATSDFQTN